MNNSILVTGANGFIGSHLVELLIKSGKNIIALNEYNSFNHLGWLENLNLECEIVSGDIRDTEFVSRLLARSESVVNLAALIAIPYSYNAGRSYFETNTFGVLNILEAIRGTDKRLIHISTSEVYGTPESTPISEEHKIKPQSPYAASKAAADNLVEGYTNSYELNTLILRPFNTYGPRQSLRAIIPTIISQVLNSKDYIEVGSVTPVRDFTFVSDTVRGIMAALNSNHTNKVIQLGTGESVSILDLIEKVFYICGVKKEIKIDESRVRPINSEVKILLSSPMKAFSELGWTPQISLEIGLKETISWIESQSKFVTKSSNYNL